MVMRDLPVLQTKDSATKVDAEGNVGRGAYSNGSKGVNQGERGAAHLRARDAYRDVPILVKPPWGHDIALYFFAGGISCGAFVLGSLADLAGGPRRQGLARTAHYIAFAAMLPCPALLIHDLGRRARFHHMLRIFKPSSPMNLGAWALSVHGAFATVTALHALSEEIELPVMGRLVGPLLRLLPRRVLAAAGIPSALTLGGYTGVLLGTTSVPLWAASPLLGGLFMSSSLSTGAAAVTLAAGARGGGEEDEGLARLDLILSAAEAAALAGYVATSGRAARPLLGGMTGLLMAGATAGIVGAPVLEAVGLHAKAGKGRLGAIASAVTLAAGLLLRYGVVFAGHKSALDREETLAYTEPSKSATGWGRRP